MRLKKKAHPKSDGLSSLASESGLESEPQTDACLTGTLEACGQSIRGLLALRKCRIVQEGLDLCQNARGQQLVDRCRFVTKVKAATQVHSAKGSLNESDVRLVKQIQNGEVERELLPFTHLDLV